MACQLKFDADSFGGAKSSACSLCALQFEIQLATKMVFFLHWYTIDVKYIRRHVTGTIRDVMRMLSLPVDMLASSGEDDPRQFFRKYG